MIDGILLVDKAQGWTSHDVVARVRRLAGQRQVGHAGTLDPLATGLLLVVLGRATRMSGYLMESTKTYRAEVVLGVATTTDDAEGEIVSRADASGVTREHVEACLSRLSGEIEQVPPMYAAVKRDGKKLYELARAGKKLDVPPRRVRIDRIEVEAFRPPLVRLTVQCGPGTYIRALARDLGHGVGVGGYLHALRRLSSGGFSVECSHTLEALETKAISDVVEPLDRAVAEWPAAIVDADEETRVMSGMGFASPDCERLRVYGTDGMLIALARAKGGTARPFRVFSRVGA